MRKLVLIVFPFVTVFLSSCSSPLEKAVKADKADEPDLVTTEKGPINLDGAGAAEVLASDSSITILDIRTPEEFAEGHIKGAVNIDFTAGDFEAKVSELDREKPYLVHCASGNRSGQSMPVFDKLKFSRLYHLSSGFKGWVADGQPVEK